MKKLILAAIVYLSFAVQAFAANSSTLIMTSKFMVQTSAGYKLEKDLYTYRVVLDTAADLTVRAAASGKHAIVNQILYVEGTASNITFKSDSTTLVTIEMGSNAGLGERVGTPILWTIKGEALVLNPASGGITTALISVYEDDKIVAW